MFDRDLPKRIRYAESRVYCPTIETDAVRFLLEDVNRGTSYCARLQRFNQRRLIDNRPARRIDQPGSRLHQGKFGSSDKPLGGATQDQVDRNYVCVAEQLIFRN